MDTGAMLGWAIRNVVVWGAVSLACVYVWKHRDQIEALQRVSVSAENDPVRKPATQPAAKGQATVAVANTLSVKPDNIGQFYVEAAVNGAPMRFIVDTGASFVTLRLEDARAAGINTSSLHFTDRSSTANGVVRVAPVQLRELRIGQLVMEDVQAAVIDAPLNIPLLGMSFLRRLEGYEIHDGSLVMSW
jgi:aspartyl protease family protein